MPARDGETLSDERQTKLTREALSWFKKQHNAPCGDPKCDSVYCYAAQQIATVAALRAELADARADKERLDWLESEWDRERATLWGISPPPRSLFRSNMPITRAAIDAARAASGEDASHAR